MINPNTQNNYQNYPYLLNPYQQLTCWLMYRLSEVETGERLRAALLDLKTLMLAFDKSNKEKHSFSLDNWSPYNIWMDIAVSEYVNGHIDITEERLFIKRQHPEQHIIYKVDFFGFYRLTKERLAFEQAFPNQEAYEAFDIACREIQIFNTSLNVGAHTHGGDSINVFQTYIDDHKIREESEIFDTDPERMFLSEPDIYPTYLVYPKAFQVDDKVEITGVYLPDSPLKNIAAYSIDAPEFFETRINEEDTPKLGQPIKRVYGHIEYGLYDPSSPYYDDPNNPYDIYSGRDIEWIETDWYYVIEIPPNTEGIPNNPLRLEHLRYPLKADQDYISLAQLKQRDGYVYENPDAMVEQYYQVVNRYEKFYRDYLLSHDVDPSRLLPYR